MALNLDQCSLHIACTTWLTLTLYNTQYTTRCVCTAGWNEGDGKQSGVTDSGLACHHLLDSGCCLSLSVVIVIITITVVVIGIITSMTTVITVMFFIVITPSTVTLVITTVVVVDLVNTVVVTALYELSRYD